MQGTKVLVAIMSLDIGGAETYVLELCKALTKKGMQVYVASNGGAYEPELVACGVIHYKVPLHNKRPFNIIGAYHTLKKIILEHDIRLVHAHARIPAFICGFLQRKLNFRFVTTAHWVFTTKFPYNLLSNWGEKSLTVSEDIKDYLIQHYRVPKDNIYISINGMDTDKFSPETKPIESDLFDFTSESPCIMTLSRLDKDRSLPALLLIESAPALLERHPNTAIYIVGGGNDFDNVSAKAEAMNTQLGKNVIKMAGSQVDAARWMAASDIFVNSSRSVLEAMATGKPVVAAGNEGYIGLLNEANLPMAMATNFCYRGCGEATTEKLTADLLTILDMPPEKQAAMGAFNREFVLANYSAERMADDSIALYRSVLASASPVPVRKTDVMVSGYYGTNNSGDDLLLQSIVRDLKNRRADLSITVLSRQPKETRKQYGVNAIYRFNLFAIWRLLRRTKLLLTGGGSVIQDLTSTHSLIYYLWVIKTARRFGVKNMLYANGIGPIRNTANIKRMHKELNKVELITLREETSRRLLEEHKVTEPKIIVTVDPVFSLPLPDFDNARTELTTLGIEPGQFFCIALRAWRHNPPGFEEHVARFADYVAQQYSYTVLFISMQPSLDTEIAKKTMALMKQPAVLLESPRNMDSIRGIVGLSAFTLAMRLHTLIYAINQGVPVIGLVYDPKVQGLMETINQPFYTTVEETEADMLIDFADEILSNIEVISDQVRKAGQAAQVLAEQNADLCIELLG